MKPKYSIELDGKCIGYTFFESHDSGMGVVMGKVFFEGIESGYDLFSLYCKEKNIALNDDTPKEKFISTPTIDGLKVFNSEEIEIKGVGTYVDGIEDEFWIVVLGIPYPFYEEEFPHHAKSL
jgi:hypothetical protein